MSSQCERTNANTIENGMYGGRTAGMFGYSHFTGGFAGGQAEYVRVPFGDVNLLKLPDSVPDEKGLYLSDVLATSWNCVVDTGVEKGDVVAIWGAGKLSIHPICKILLIGNRTYWPNVCRFRLYEWRFSRYYDRRQVSSHSRAPSRL